MPFFAHTRQGVVVEASSAPHESPLWCCLCRTRVVHVRSSQTARAHFRHTCGNQHCRGSAPVSEVVSDGETLVVRSEALRRPTAAGCGTWLLDATTKEIRRYECTGDERVWFCIHTSGETHLSNEEYRVLFHCTGLPHCARLPDGDGDGDCKVLFYCEDGNVYQTACEDLLHIETNGRRQHAHMLKTIDVGSRRMLDHFFGNAWGGHTPHNQSEKTIATPIRVLSEAGRLEIDSCHREFTRRFPTVPLTVISAPPGAGKTTSIIAMMRRWKKRSLVIAFNTSTKDTMQKRIREAGLEGYAAARTLDSLCFVACSRPKLLPSLQESDKALCKEFFPDDKKAMRTNGSAKIISFRFKNPRAARDICKTHKRLRPWGDGWDASFTSDPQRRMAEDCMTFPACRYTCDVKDLLRSELDSYDVIIVDEMQDLLSAQEQRLFSQTSKPVVLVGDFMQTINDWKNQTPCLDCNCFLPCEDTPPLPCAIEWYGTWRLDPFTVRFVEERFDRRMHSYRSTEEASQVYWKTSWCTKTHWSCVGIQVTASVWRLLQFGDCE